MAGLAEASAIVGIVQVGFSFATALNTYMADLSDAGDDIASLVSDIEATFGQLRDLGKLIEKNEDTKIWSEDGLRNAKKCVTDCERTIAKLRKLLKKSTASATSEEVSRDEIDVSKLERALWPFIKPQAEVRRRELQSIKQDIMIAYSSYMIQVGTDAERKKLTDDLPRLQRTRALARRQVREAKEYRRRQISRRRRKLQPRPSIYVPPEPARGYDGKEVPYGGYVRGDRWSDDGAGSALDGEEPLVYQNIEDLEREFEEWKVEEEESKANLEAQRKKIQEEAVESWKQQQIHELETHRKKLEEERSSLRAELTKQRVAPQQIEDIINHVHPQEQVNNSLHVLNLTPASDKALSLKSNDGLTVATAPRRWRSWFRNKSSSSQDSPSARTLVNESHKISLPDIIKDPTAEGGIAPLKATYFQRSARYVQQYLGLPPVVESFDVEIPDQWLWGLCIKRQEALAHNPKKVNSVWKEFSQLPCDYRDALSQHMNKPSIYGQEDNGSAAWIMLHLECMFQRLRHSMFDRGSRKEMVGVYLVMKHKKMPRYRGTEPENSAWKNDENVPQASLEKKLPDSTSRQRSGKNGYEPRFGEVISVRGEPSPRTRSHRPSRESKYSARQPYYNVREEPEIDVQYEEPDKREREIRGHQREQEQERQREKSLERPGYGTDPIFSRPDIRSPQRTTRQRERMNDGADPRHIPKYVSFARNPISTQWRSYEREPYLAPYPGFTVPVDPDLVSPRPDSPLHNTDLSSVRKPPNFRRRRSRSRSPSPRPLRRNNTNESYHASDPIPLSPAPAQSQSQLRSFPAYPYTNRENEQLTQSEPKLEPVQILQQQQQLQVIEELSETSEISTSSGSEISEDDDNDNNTYRPGRRRSGRRRGGTKPRQETDEELLDKTLKEYINPSVASPVQGQEQAQTQEQGQEQTQVQEQAQTQVHEQAQTQEQEQNDASGGAELDI